MLTRVPFRFRHPLQPERSGQRHDLNLRASPSVSGTRCSPDAVEEVQSELLSQGCPDTLVPAVMNRRNFLSTLGGVAGATVISGLNAGGAPNTPLAHPPDPRNEPHGRVPRFGDQRDWFFDRRFGLFLHWGLYAIPAWHEQAQWRQRIPRAEYVKLARQWNPAKFDADAWLDLAERAGMKYVCLTTKHHDGFCLWDTKLTAFNTMQTPYGKDIVRQLSDACHRRGMPLCLYYSIADWNHPNYPNEGRHHELPPQPGDQPDWKRYLEFLSGQVRELCTNYGELHGFWWDMNVPKHVDPSINAMIRKLQPKAVINNRGFDEGDFGTPERDYDSAASAAPGFTQRTEACQAVGSDSWGFRANEDYYTDRHLLRSIDRYLARDANYLLNVGPMADGSIGPRETAILERVGAWYGTVKEAFENVAPASQLTANRDVLLTRRENTLYVHLCKDPTSEAVKLKPLAVSPKRATLLNTGKPVPFAVEMTPNDHVEQKGYLRLRGLPVNELANTVLVVKLEFDHLPDVSDGNPPKADKGDLRLR